MKHPHDSGCAGAGRRGQATARGQLILIGVVTMGILLISMTLVMNGFLYAQNVESEGVPPEVGEIESMQHMVATEYSQLLIQSNTYDPAPRTNYSTAVANTTAPIRTQEANAQGRLVTISKDSQTNGVLFRQADGGNFTDANGNAWNVTTSGARRFQIAVNQTTDLHKVNDTTTAELQDAFHVVVENESGATVTVYIATESGGDTIIAVDDGTELTKRYDTTNRSLTVDLVTGSVNEAHTPSVDNMTLYDDDTPDIYNTSTTYDIAVNNPDAAEGEYTLTVRNDSELEVNGSFHSPGESPYRKDVVYESRFTLVYDSASHYYAGDVRVAPCSHTATHCRSYIQATGGV